MLVESNYSWGLKEKFARLCTNLSGGQVNK